MELRVEKLVAGAKGLCHINGKSVIVSNALPDELVDVDIISEKNGFIEARTKRVIEPSKDRIEPICPYYTICGGCDFQIVDEHASAMLKEEIVKDNLRRIGKIEELPPFISPSYGHFEGYRSRIRVHVDLKSKKQGFLSKSSNALVDIDHCIAIDARLNNLLKERCGDLYRKARALMFENRVNRDTGFVEVPLFSGDDKVSTGSDIVDATIGGIAYKVNANVFFQSNLILLPELLSFVKDNAVGNTIMDLYSGVGTFSALFDDPGKEVYAVERQRECLELSRKNAPNAISYTADVSAWAKRMKKNVDTVIVDPPRVGLDKGVAEMISSFNPKRIIYISCNSVTASRDIPLFDGYRLECAKVFDFYPGSSHIETEFILSRE